MDQKKRYRKKQKTDNDHKVDLMDQKNVFSDHFFSEEALSEESLSKNPEKTEEDVIRKKVFRKIVICMYGHTYSKSMDQPGKVANPACGQLNKEKEYSPVRVRA